MVRVLGVNASPRPYGNTRKALLIALRGAELEGASYNIVDLYNKNILPCIGCVSDDVKLCKYPCPINDDMKTIYEDVLKSDVLILATPIYWYGVSGPLKNFIDRLTVFENMIFIDGRSWVEGKVASFIAMGNDVGAIAVIQNLMAILNSMGFIIPPWALAYYTGKGDVCDDINTVLDLVNLGRISVIMAKVIKGEEVAPKQWYRADEEFRRIALSIAEDVRKYVEKLIGY